MALIPCAECQNQVSDSASICPKCGFPVSRSLEKYRFDNGNAGDEYLEPAIKIDVSSVGNNSVINSERTEIVKAPNSDFGQDFQKKRKIPMVAIVVSVAIVICVLLAAVFTKKSEDYKQALHLLDRDEYEQAGELFRKARGVQKANSYIKYCDALTACSKGDYGQACDLLLPLRDFEDSKAVLRNIYYETRLFEGMTDLRSQLKNADSAVFNDIKAYEAMGSEESPSFVVSISGMNGFGGYSDGYGVLQENGDEYECIGIVSSRVMNNYQNGIGPSFGTDLDDYVGAAMIKVVLEDSDEIQDAVDRERVANIVKENNYTNIKRLEELTYDDISE